MSNCKECDKHRSLRSLEQIAGITPPTKRRERRMEGLVQTYGVLGVLRLMTLHFERLHASSRMEEHQVIWNLLANFERIVSGRLEKVSPESAAKALERAKTSLAEAGIQL
jgi:hypothetical protein